MAQLESHAEILGILRNFYRDKEIYKELYEACPGAFETPIRDWAELRERLRLGGYSGKVPDSAPSPIMSWLSEEFFFRDGQDVAIVKNDRYCPPFWHKLEFIKAVVVVRGSASFFAEGGMFVIEEGNLCIVPPGVENATFSNDDGDIVVNIIVKRSTFERSFASLLSESSMLSDYLWRMLYKKSGGDVLFFKKKADGDITEQVLEIYRELNFEDPVSNIMLKSLLMLFFGLMLRYYEIDRACGENTPGGKKDVLLADIVKYMNDHKQTVTLPELAARFHFSEGYLSRYIRRETGEPFNVLLREMRIEQAAVMLRNSNVSVEEVSGAVGYSDISRFYRNFRERYGMTPAQFRRSEMI